MIQTSFKHKTAMNLTVILLVVLATCLANNPSSPQASDCGIDVTCHVFKRVATFQHNTTLQVEENFECLQGDIAFDLSLPQYFIDSHPQLDQGLTTISITDACVKDMQVTIPSNATITVVPNKRRHLDRKATIGNVTLLVVRATERGYPELRSNNVVRDMIFGNVAGSLTRQMSECSFGKFNILKARGPGINDGVLEVDLDIDVNGMYNREVENRLVALLSRYGGETAFDHVAYCLPYGTYNQRDGLGTKDWLAYAIVNHARSVYNHFWCGLLTGSQHEIGHNLGLHHAGSNAWKYGDATGVMGWSKYDEYGPRACFNAQKNVHLGWYDDRYLDLTNHVPGFAFRGFLVSFVDYNATEPGQFVLIRVGNLYLQYNRARDFNEGTRQYANRVVIVSDPKQGSTASNLEAALGHNIAVSTFIYPNYDDSGYDLVFKVCDQVQGPPLDYVELSIHLDNGAQSSLCSRNRRRLQANAPSSRGDDVANVKIEIGI